VGYAASNLVVGQFVHSFQIVEYPMGPSSAGSHPMIRGTNRDTNYILNRSIEDHDGVALRNAQVLQIFDEEVV